MGSALESRTENSYILYNNSLVDECLYIPSLGCSRTITFWLNHNNGHHNVLLTTVALHPFNTGIDVELTDNDLFRFVIALPNITYLYRTRVPSLRPQGVWHHIAIAYKMEGAIPQVGLYVNFADAHLDYLDGLQITGKEPQAFMVSDSVTLTLGQAIIYTADTGLPAVS